MPVDPTYEHLKAPTLTFNANQLILTVARKQTRTSNARELVYEYDKANDNDREFRDGRFAELTGADWEVKVAASGTTTLLGVAQDFSSPKEAKITRPNLAPDIETQDFPNLIEGVQIELFQWWFVRNLPIASGASFAVVPGESVRPDSGVAHEWEGLDSNTGNGTLGLTNGVAGTEALVAIASDGVFV